MFMLALAHRPKLLELHETKSLPWIPTFKTGQPNSFGYESKGSLEIYGEVCTKPLTNNPQADHA